LHPSHIQYSKIEEEEKTLLNPEKKENLLAVSWFLCAREKLVLQAVNISIRDFFSILRYLLFFPRIHIPPIPGAVHNIHVQYVQYI